MHTDTHTDMHMHTHTDTYRDRHTYIHRHTCAHMDMCTDAHSHAHRHRDTHRPSLPRVQPRADHREARLPGSASLERASLPSTVPYCRDHPELAAMGQTGSGALRAHTAPRPGSFLLRAQTQKPQPGRGGATQSHAPRGHAPRKDPGATPSLYPLWDRTPRSCPL